MKPNRQEQTIVALSTPYLKGSIAILRISGKEARRIAESMTEKPVREANKIYVRNIRAGTIQDQAVLLYFQGPHSYTGEDMIEIQCHSSPVIIQEILRHCIKQGAASAEGGEFTKRAFLNGKMDLLQAEAVADLINAETAAQVNAAHETAAGKLSHVINALQNRLLDNIAAAEVAIDYPEEGIEEETAQELCARLEALYADLIQLSATYESGKIVREGIRVALTGKPNTGKSSLMNSLLGKERAIVSALEGTTRDTIEDRYLYRGIQFTLIDTAGIREGKDEPERLGILRSRAAAEEADLILSIAEPQKTYTDVLSPKPVIFVKNKMDTVERKQQNEQADIWVSAKQNQNIDTLKDLIYQKTCASVRKEGTMLHNLRQYEAVRQAAENLHEATAQIGKVTLDCILVDLLAASDALGSVTGITGSDAVISRIFERFCVGK